MGIAKAKCIKPKPKIARITSGVKFPLTISVGEVVLVGAAVGIAVDAVAVGEALIVGAKEREGLGVAVGVGNFAD